MDTELPQLAVDIVPESVTRKTKQEVKDEGDLHPINQGQVRIQQPGFLKLEVHNFQLSSLV